MASTIRSYELGEKMTRRFKLSEQTEFKNSTLGRSTVTLILDVHEEQGVDVIIRQIQDLEALVQNQQGVDQQQGNNVNQSSSDTAFIWYILRSVGMRLCVARRSRIERS